MYVLNSEEGKQLLKKSEDLGLLLVNLNLIRKRQLLNYTCSVASLSQVCNAWFLKCQSLIKSNLPSQLPYDESNFKNLFDNTKNKNGMVFDQLGDFIKIVFKNLVEVRMMRIGGNDKASFEKFKEDILITVKSGGQISLILNYYLYAVSSEFPKYGHFSPVSGLVQSSNNDWMVCVADTFVEPYWTNLQSLWNGINTIDQESNKGRGYIVLNWLAPLPNQIEIIEKS